MSVNVTPVERGNERLLTQKKPFGQCLGQARIYYLLGRAYRVVLNAMIMRAHGLNFVNNVTCPVIAVPRLADTPDVCQPSPFFQIDGLGSIYQ